MGPLVLLNQTPLGYGQAYQPSSTNDVVHPWTRAAQATFVAATQLDDVAVEPVSATRLAWLRPTARQAAADTPAYTLRLAAGRRSQPGERDTR